MSDRNKVRGFNLAPLEETLLAVLVDCKLYGLEIIKAVEEATEGKRRIGFGSLYPSLHKLEKRGFVNSRWGADKPEERGGARRKYYKATGLGVKALRETQRIRDKLTSWKPAWGRA